MDKKKRSKCETSSRTTIILNSLNPKEKIIEDFLLNQYNKSDTIKDILYQYIISNNLHGDKLRVSNCVVNDKLMRSNNTTNGNHVISECVVKDKNIISNDFNINLDNIEDKVIKVEHDPEEEIKQATNNALDFIKNGF